jgi:hypothetical protein
VPSLSSHDPGNALLNGSVCVSDFFFLCLDITTVCLAMKITIDSEKMKRTSVFVATPMYGGMACGVYIQSLLQLQNLLGQRGVSMQCAFLFNESLITRARNTLVDKFLDTDCTHLLFIDADIQFEAQDVIALLALDKDVIGGPYPKKTIHWENVARAARKHPDLDPKALASVTGHYVFNALSEAESFNTGELVDVTEIGTGFMLVKRDVFNRMKEAYPHLRYKTDHLGVVNKYIHAYFDTLIDSADSVTGGGTDRYLSEDYAFCQLWRKLGGKVYMCPWMKTQHVGTYAFTGDMGAVATLTGML